MKRAIVHSLLLAIVASAVATSTHVQPKSNDDIEIIQGFELGQQWSRLRFHCQNRSSASISFPEFGECGNHIRWTDPSGFTSDDCLSARRAPSYKSPSLEAGRQDIWQRGIPSIFDWIELIRGKGANANRNDKNGLYTLRWEFTNFQNGKVTQRESEPIYLWGQSVSKIQHGSDGEDLGIKVDKLHPSEADPADVPDPTPTPVPLSKMLPGPTDKGFSQTLAAVTDVQQADIAFILLNGSEKPLVISPLAVASQSNMFSVVTPDGKQVVDDPATKGSALSETIKPGELKIWKVNIKKWFDTHKLTQPGFYTLTWTCQGQKSETFNLYIPTLEEKARLDKEAARR